MRCFINMIKFLVNWSCGAWNCNNAGVTVKPHHTHCRDMWWLWNLGLQNPQHGPLPGTKMLCKLLVAPWYLPPLSTVRRGVRLHGEFCIRIVLFPVTQGPDAWACKTTAIIVSYDGTPFSLLRTMATLGQVYMFFRQGMQKLTPC